MELKERKRINNKLPGFVDGFGNYGAPDYGFITTGTPNATSSVAYNAEYAPYTPASQPQSFYEKYPQANPAYEAKTTQNRIKAPDAAKFNPWAALGAMAAEGVGNGLLAANKSADSFLADAGVSQGSVSGFGYQKQNYVDTSRQLKDYDRDTALSFLTNPIEGITRIFGRHQFEKRMRQANNRAQLANTYNRSGALSDYLGQQYASKYGNDESQILWAAARGKDKVESSIGKIDAPATARVAKDEPIIDNINDVDSATGHVVRNGKRGADTNLASVNKDTVILGGDRDMRDGYKFQDKGLFPTKVLELINKYESRPRNINDKLRGNLGRQTDEFQSKTLSGVKSQVVAQLKDLADQQAFQHSLQDYTGLINAKRGKDKTWYRSVGENNDYKSVYLYPQSPLDIENWNREISKLSGDTVYHHKSPKWLATGEGASSSDLENRQKYLELKSRFDELNKSAKPMIPLRRDIDWVKNILGFRNGKDKLPGFVGGNNWWVDGLGVATGLGQLFSSAFQRVKKPNTYVSNPYANAALTGLAGLNINPYPMMQQMRDQENRNLYQINRAGGLSGAQKAFANVATGIGTQRNIADLGANIQAQNNQYKTNYYSTLLNAGQADRAARIGANQYDLDYFSKAHNAKLQMSQMGIYNMLNALQQGYANAFKRKQFNKVYDLYAQDMALNKKKTNAEIANMKDEAAYNRRYLADLRKKGIIS